MRWYTRNRRKLKERRRTKQSWSRILISMDWNRIINNNKKPKSTCHTINSTLIRRNRKSMRRDTSPRSTPSITNTNHQLMDLTQDTKRRFRSLLSKTSRTFSSKRSRCSHTSINNKLSRHKTKNRWPSWNNKCKRNWNSTLINNSTRRWLRCSRSLKLRPLSWGRIKRNINKKLNIIPITKKIITNQTKPNHLKNKLILKSIWSKPKRAKLLKRDNSLKLSKINRLNRACKRLRMMLNNSKIMLLKQINNKPQSKTHQHQPHKNWKLKMQQR